MADQDRLLAIIPARGGSKRLPGKNVRILGDKPLISWSIDVAKNISNITDILVSTDSEQIASIGRSSGALVPWLRPTELSTDSASSVDVVLHALEWYERSYGRVDGVIVLQPTSPFRTVATIRGGIDLFKSYGRKPIVAVSLTQSHPMWTFTISNNYIKPYFNGDGLKMRSQDLPPAYVVNGVLYIIAPEDLRLKKSFFEGDIVPLVIESSIEGIDIDTEFDFMVAKACVDERKFRI